MSDNSDAVPQYPVNIDAQTGPWLQSLRLGAHRVDPRGNSTSAKLAGTRACFDTAANSILQRSRLEDKDLVLSIFDLDHLGSVNDDNGFDVGDLLIRQTELELLGALRDNDLLYNLGCGSWAIVTPDVSNVDAYAHIDKLRDKIERRLAIHFTTADVGDLTIATLSAGLIVSEHSALTLPEMMHAASQATLASKLHGGNRTTAWGEATQNLVGRSEGRRRAQRDAQLATVLSLAEALDLRDTDTSNHSNMVARYSELMAIELGMSEEHVKRVRIAGLLHDIGKIGVPDSVLRKPAKLNDEEWAMMQDHPNIGARLLASIDAEDIRSWVLAHHERPDGRGYPLGLTNDEIPIEAKILSVADAYEAMTVDRVYRVAPGPEIARAELERLRGLQFDTEVVDVFLKILDTHNFDLEHADAPSILDQHRKNQQQDAA